MFVLSALIESVHIDSPTVLQKTYYVEFFHHDFPIVDYVVILFVYIYTLKICRVDTFCMNIYHFLPFNFTVLNGMLASYCTNKHAWVVDWRKSPPSSRCICTHQHLVYRYHLNSDLHLTKHLNWKRQMFLPKHAYLQHWKSDVKRYWMCLSWCSLNFVIVFSSRTKSLVIRSGRCIIYDSVVVSDAV